jgi:hypothetical protein
MAMASLVAVHGRGRCGRLESVGVAVLVAASVVLRLVVAGGHLGVGTFLCAVRHDD